MISRYLMNEREDCRYQEFEIPLSLTHSKRNVMAIKYTKGCPFLWNESFIMPMFFKTGDRIKKKLHWHFCFLVWKRILQNKKEQKISCGIKENYVKNTCLICRYIYEKKGGRMFFESFGCFLMECDSYEQFRRRFVF